MKQLYRHRFAFGIATAMVLLVILVMHLKDWVKVDEVALGLIAGVAGSLVFALSEQLGIKEITAGPFKLEIFERAKEAADEVPRAQRGQLAKVLRKNSDLFPVIGARILWVDDHPEVLIPHRQVLRRLGIQVLTARSTDEAKRELERDGDFILVIQDRVRNGTDDAKALVKWLADVGRPQYNLQAPLAVYSFDSFDPSVGVSEEDWFTKDFSKLLSRVVDQVRNWTAQRPEAQEKSWN